MNYAELIENITTHIAPNGEQAITAQVLQDVLVDMVEEMGQTNDEDISLNSNNALQFADRIYNSLNPDGLGYVILRPGNTFAEQVTEANTIYEVRYDFELASNFSLPVGTTLFFNGGSIYGAGTLTFTQTKILGQAKITSSIAGKIAGTVHAEWFGMVSGDQSFDNAPIIEKVCKTFEQVVIGGGDYYCATPIDLSAGNYKGLFVYGNLYYTTANTSNPFLTFSGRRSINIYGNIDGPVQNNTDNVDQSIGILFKDCNGSRIYVRQVRFFHTDIRVYGSTAGVGNAYNSYTLGYLYGAKVLLELKADNPGWVTSNTFRCLRMTNFSGYTSADTAVLIDGGSVGFSDIVFEKLTIEGLTQSEPIKITNAHKFVFNNIRNEGNYETLVYANNVLSGEINCNYGDVTIRSEAGQKCAIDTKYDFASYNPMEKAIFIPGGTTRRLIFNAIDATKSQNINYKPLAYIPVGIIVPISREPYRFAAPSKFSVTVVYYDSSLAAIARSADYMPSGSVAFQNSGTVSTGYLTSSRAIVQYVALPTLPASVAYVGYFFTMNNTTTENNADEPIFSVPVAFMNNRVNSVFTVGPYTPHNKYGSTARRPVFAENYRQYLIGYEYFDTTLGKPIYAQAIASDGTATWVDATGATV